MQTPTPSPAPPSTLREKTREAARARREERRLRRRQFLDLVVSGFEYDEIADKAGVSVATVRREVSQLLAERAPEPIDRYVALQLSRLQKAMRVVDLKIEDGEVKAVPALTALMGKYDRYYGLAAALAGARPQSTRPDATLSPPGASDFEDGMAMAPRLTVAGRGEREAVCPPMTVRERMLAALAAKMSR